jgi:antitoxin component of MazEF toxin-antitoxin module
MTATLLAQRHIVLPPEVEARAPMVEGQEYHVLVSSAGVIMLRPKRPHKRTLVEHLEALRGLEIEHRFDPIPDRVHL